MVLAALGVSRWYDFKEKDLVKVLDASNIEKIMYSKPPLNGESLNYNRTISEPESIKGLINFLSQYKVKKIGARNFISEYPAEQFRFVLVYKDGSMSMPSLLERDIALAEFEYYTILNGPIDYEWLGDYLAGLE